MIFRMFLAVLVFAPLPFGSNRAWPMAFLALALGLLLAAWAVSVAVASNRPAVGLRRMWPAVVPFALVIAWAFVQSLPVVPPAWANPLWGEAAAILGPLPATISLDPAATLAGILRLCTYAAAFWLALQYGADRDNARRLLVWLAVAGGLYAAYALAAFLSGSNTILWFEKWTSQRDLTGTFVNKNNYTDWAGLCLLAVLALLVRDASHRVATDSLRMAVREGISWLLQSGAVYLLAAVLLFSSITLAHSRAGFLSLLAATAVLFLVQAVGGGGRRLLSLGLAVGVLGVFLVLFNVGGGTMLKRMAGADLEHTSRDEIYAATLQAIETAPVLGYGLGSFADGFNAFRSDNMPAAAIHAHSTYLELAFELGVPAAALLILSVAAMAAFCLVGLVRRRRDRIYPTLGLAATVLLGLHSAVDFGIQIPAVAVTYFAIMGVGCAQSFPSSERRGGPEGR